MARGIRIVSAAARSAALAACALAAIGHAPALADISRSFITLPDAKGSYRGKDHPDAIVAEAHDWNNGAGRGVGAFGPGAARGPSGAKPGTPGRLIAMVASTGPDAALLAARCASGALLPSIDFTEKSQGRPGDPVFWHYRLRNVKIAACPLADGAAARAFVFTYEGAEWLNFDPKAPAPAIAPAPLIRPASGPDGSVKSYLITWLGIATDVEPTQCPVLASKPDDGDYYRYRPAEEAALMRADIAKRGITDPGQTEQRGPGGMNVILLPGIVPDPGLPSPVTRLATGIDLDGDKGRKAGKGALAQRIGYRSPDGRAGIDNQLQHVMGCIAGYRGKGGYRNQTDNARRADGNIVTLIEVSGIDDPLNDTLVEVALIHAVDKPIRDVGGKSFVPGYSFRATDNSAFTKYNIRLRGRIENGVVVTTPIADFAVFSGQGPAYTLQQAQLRLEPLPDGSVKGFLGGFQDWRYYANYRASGYAENLFGYKMPGVYYALKRNADGLWNPATREFDGISTVYELDTVTAFLVDPAPAGAK